MPLPLATIKETMIGANIDSSHIPTILISLAMLDHRGATATFGIPEPYTLSLGLGALALLDTTVAQK